MSHRETLVLDIFAYVEQYHPDQVEELLEEVEEIASAVDVCLKAHKPGVVMSEEYRANNLQGWVMAYEDMLTC